MLILLIPVTVYGHAQMYASNMYCVGQIERKAVKTGIFFIYINRDYNFRPLPFQVSLMKLAIAWASYQIRKIAACACAGNAGNLFPRHRLQRKLRVCDPSMHHGTCVTHVPRCVSGSLTRGGGENVPGITDSCATRNYTYPERGPFP